MLVNDASSLKPPCAAKTWISLLDRANSTCSGASRWTSVGTTTKATTSSMDRDQRYGGASSVRSREVQCSVRANPSLDRRFQLAPVNKVLGLPSWTGIKPPHSAEGHDGLWVRHRPGVHAVRIRPESTNCNYCPSQKQGYEARAPTRNYSSISRHPDVSKCGNFGRLSFWVP